MKKIYCDKITIFSIVLTFFILFNAAFFGLHYNQENILILGIIEVLFCVIAVVLLSFFLVKKLSRKIIIAENYLEYVSKKDTFKTPISYILELAYISIDRFNCELILSLVKEEENIEKKISLTKGDAKRIARLINKDIKCLKNGKHIKPEEEKSYTLKEIKEFIIKYRINVIFGFLGLAFSTLFIVLYIVLNNSILNYIICGISFVVAFGQIFYIYLNKLKLWQRLLLSIVIPVVFVGVLLLVLWFGFDKSIIFIDCIYYSIMLLPAFAVITLLLLLLLG